MAHGVRDVLVSEVLLDDLEGSRSLAATADSLGHVTIKVAVRGPNFQDRAGARSCLRQERSPI
jgi:hypothetical protein